MTIYKKINLILKEDQKDRAFLKFKKYEQQYLAPMLVRDLDRAEKVNDILKVEPKLSKKTLFEAAVILHHCPTLKANNQAREFAKLSVEAGFKRSEKLLEFIDKNTRELTKIVNKGLKAVSR